MREPEIHDNHEFKIKKKLDDYHELREDAMLA